jgi:RNA polymerase sigma factor for flagellar operon FliA
MSAAREYALAGGVTPEALVKRQAPFVKRIAARLLVRLPENVELDDLMQAGFIALLEAARQYSPAKGASFETYASIRVRGAMLDEVRSNDWAPRSVYKKRRDISAATRRVENRTGCHAGPRDIAAELGVTLDEYFGMVASAAAARMPSLDQEDASLDAQFERQVDRRANPVTDIESSECHAAIAAAIRQLPEREARVMALCYDEEMNLKQIGAVLGVSESRVCQLRGQALDRLRAQLGDWSG